MKTALITNLLFGSMIYLTSCQDDSKLKEMENRLSEKEDKLKELESTVSKFELLVKEQDSIKSEKEAELKQFEDILVSAFENVFGSITFELSDYIGVSSISSVEFQNKSFINKGFIQKGELLYSNRIGNNVYNWDLTSKGRNCLYKTNEKWNNNISRNTEEWFFKFGKGKFNGVTKVEYINSNQARVTYETILLSKTELSGTDSYIGEITEHEMEFKRNASSWVISKANPFHPFWVK